jgi:hypothetical protein
VARVFATKSGGTHDIFKVVRPTAPPSNSVIMVLNTRPGSNGFYRAKQSQHSSSVGG